MNRTQLPEFFRATFHPDSKFWDLEVNWNNELEVSLVIALYHKDMEKAFGDIDRMQSIAGGLISDLVRLSNELEEHWVVLRFVQFLVATTMVDFFLRNKMLHYMYDWICNGISDEVSTDQQREYRQYYLEDFVSCDHPVVIAHLNDAVCHWASGLFYYSRHAGGHQQLASDFLDRYIVLIFEIALKGDFNLPLIDALVQVSGWCEHHNLDKPMEQICKLLHEIYVSCSDPQIKTRIAFYCCLIKKQVSPLSKDEWIRLVNENHLQDLRAQDYLQFVLTQCKSDADLIEKNRDEIKRAITLYHDYLKKVRDNKEKSNAYEFSRIYLALANTWGTLFKAGKLKLYIDLIGHFFQIPENELLKDNFAVVIPNTPDGLLYCLEGSSVINAFDPHQILVDLLKLTNQFTGTANTFDDILNIDIPVQERFGAPDFTVGGDLQNVLEKIIGVDTIQSIKNLQQLAGLHIFYGNVFPVQPILTKHLGFTLPIIQSFQQPRPCRQIREVFIWQGHTNLSEAECLGLKEIFERKGINVTLVLAENATKKDFIDHYRSDKYDLFWVSCHGQFSHFEAHKSYLDLGNDIKMPIDELAKYKAESNERRLLVLDACDGATTGLFNSPASIGIGAAGVHSRQSLVSHAWPVDNYSGMILGVLLGYYLAEGMTYEQAHAATINKFCEGKEAVYATVSTACDNDEVLERIQNTGIDFNNFYYWGSLTYLI